MPLRIAVLGFFCLAVGVPDGGNPIDIVGLISHLGFPVFVSIWFMWRLEKRIDNLIASQEKLTTIVTVLVKTVDDNIPVAGMHSAGKNPR